MNERMILYLTCPHCDRRITGHWSAFVFPNAAYICERCDKASVLTVSLRAPSDEEQESIDADPNIAAMKTARAAVKRGRAAVNVPPVRHARALTVVESGGDQ